jgi:phosphatidylserine decarboxylase
MALTLTTCGRREWIACSAIFAGLLGAIAALAWVYTPWLAPAAVPVLAAWGWAMWFFRDPDRLVPDEPGVFVSSADGIVADITPVGPGEALGVEGTRIGVFMNIFNVHVNRVPCDAQVVSIDHQPGVFLDVRKPEAAFRNESATIRLSVTHGGRQHAVLVRQVAGLVARRIVTDLSPGQQVHRGQRMGMIKFGSRLELWVPVELVGDIRVSVGDPAVAGQTVLVAAPKESANA